jgi:hypothetical protein
MRKSQIVKLCLVGAALFLLLGGYSFTHEQVLRDVRELAPP